MGTGEEPRPLLRIGHKGADAVVPGNTIASFERAVEIGVDVVELDVLRPRSDFPGGADWRDAEAGPADAGADPLLVAHDWAAAERGDPLTLAEALDAFARPPLDRVGLDLDLKIAGREDEVIAALRERELTGRAMISTMEIASSRRVRELAPGLRAGWTFPRATRAWDRKRWARPVLIAAVAAMRRRLPSLAARRLPELGVHAMWVYHPLVTERLARACGAAGVELYAWTVDDLARMRELVAIGVDGIVTNDPRLFVELGAPTRATRSAERLGSAPRTPGPPP
ncbi:MAG TPA: glycerophosphodiester phosphodiesterase [Solirubrobacterales bacterium]